MADSGIQVSTLAYPNFSATQIEAAVEEMYRRLYFRPQAIIPILKFSSVVYERVKSFSLI